MQNADVKKIDTVKVANSASDIRNSAKQLHNYLDTIHEIVKGTEQYWYNDGNDAPGPGEAFRDKFTELSKNFDEFEEQIKAYANYLDQVVDEVKRVDGANADTFINHLP